MEDNKEKTTDELLKENNELLKTLIKKLDIIRVAAWIFVVGTAISVVVYLLIALDSCTRRNGSNNYYKGEDSAIIDTTVMDSISADSMY